ncbi:unnamed protein product [Coregonus sp. 'balchen']|nr:unnamed protein product [Coregonus sp. 'balchen']
MVTSATHHQLDFQLSVGGAGPCSLSPARLHNACIFLPSPPFPLACHSSGLMQYDVGGGTFPEPWLRDLSDKQSQVMGVVRGAASNVGFQIGSPLPPPTEPNPPDRRCLPGFYSRQELQPHLERARGLRMTPTEMKENRISLHRSLGNNARLSDCVGQRFRSCPPLPTTSVIIVSVSSTVYSILHTAPASLLTEILLVDDASTDSECGMEGVRQLGGQLEIVPCSVVGHIFCSKSPHTFPKGTSVIAHNQVHLAELKNSGSKTCLDVGENNKGGKKQLSCTHATTWEETRYFSLNHVQCAELRHDIGKHLCLHATPGAALVSTEFCCLKGLGTRWTLSKWFFPEESLFGKCLTVVGGKVVMSSCDSANLSQHWALS